MIAYAVQPPPTSTDYVGIGCDEVVSIYKRAYVEAGFKFKKTTSLEHPYRGVHGETIDVQVRTDLIFEFSMTKFGEKKPAVATFNFISPAPNVRERPSCAAYRRTFGVDPETHGDERYALLNAMRSADNKAIDAIVKSLGKAVLPVGDLLDKNNH